jgi:hypothetical protein
MRHVSNSFRNSLRDINRVGVILINLGQIASSVPNMIHVPWPQLFLNFVDFFDIFNIDFASITGATCDKSVNFEVRFTIMAICPFVIIVFSLLAYMSGRRNIEKQFVRLRRVELKEIRERKVDQCYVNLFRIIDDDRSGTIDAKEFIDLLNLLGFKSKHLNEKMVYA